MTDKRDFRRRPRARLYLAQPKEIVSIDTTDDRVWLVAQPAEAEDPNQDGILVSITYGGSVPRSLPANQVAVKGTRANYRTAGRRTATDKLTATRHRIGTLETDDTPVVYSEEYPLENPVEDI